MEQIFYFVSNKSDQYVILRIFFCHEISICSRVGAAELCPLVVKVTIMAAARGMKKEK